MTFVDVLTEAAVSVTTLADHAPCPRAELPADTLELARHLLGKLLVRALPEGLAIGRIVETEGYPPGDPAAHHWRGLTRRNRSLFLERGHAYVYRAYGTSWMLNVSAEAAGVGGCVLIRAIAPEAGSALMAARRGNVAARDIARGPGRLAAALGIDLTLDGLDLCAAGPLFLCADSRPAGAIGVSTRIGITRAADKPWRFFVRGSRFLSGPASLNRQPG